MTDITRTEATQLYDRSDFDTLEKRVSQLWPNDFQSLPKPDVAEMCRYLFLLARRRKDLVASNVWRARAMSAAALTGEMDTMACLIMEPVFNLADEGSYAEARVVLNEMLRIMPEKHPNAELVRGRLYHEKLAYFFTKDGLFQEARNAYIEASKHCGDDLRGALKVRGGATITGYLDVMLRVAAHEDRQSQILSLITEMEKVATEARRNGFPDVSDPAESNLKLMKAGETEDWIPFETV